MDFSGRANHVMIVKVSKGSIKEAGIVERAREWNARLDADGKQLRIGWQERY
jgi:hypothetical protein